ncbi:MAG: hypothetical protein IH852_04375 [Bacteroidetes bacterium]|nr:hypothetical protein [Bacteroidota bacterium]
MSKFPKSIWWLAGGVLLFSLIDKIITTIRDGETLVVTEGWLYLLLMSGVLIVIGLFISIFRIAYKNFHQDKPFETPIYVPKSLKNSKMLPHHIDLYEEKDSSYEFTVKAVRSFHPEDNPGVERFLKAITIKPILCSKCKNELAEVSSDFPRDIVYSCPQFTCENHLKIKLKRNRYELFIKQIMFQIISDIRKDYKKYWQLYVDKYNELTKGKYDDYYEPLSFNDLRFYL